MKATSALAGGLAGACAITVIHEIIKRVDPDAPRMDLLGMDAISKTLENAGMPVPEEDSLFNVALAGDLASNSLFYSLAGIGRKKSVMRRGLLLGLAAGVGAVVLPKPLGLTDGLSNKTDKTKLLTVGLYTIGGLVASTVSNLIEGANLEGKKSKRKPKRSSTRRAQRK